MVQKDEVLRWIETNAAELVRLADSIWEHPELGFKEAYASSLLADVLQREGFSVERDASGIPNAFMAQRGTGQPVIGVLGEYDALPGLSQKVSATREPLVEGAPGHACGHNLLGVASLGAVLGAAAALQQAGLPGTVRYYGCPAEETLMGKVFMAREEMFSDLDAALTWHPMYGNTVWSASSAALNSFKLSFHGVSAHAGAAPEAGRSALDAVMLTDVGVNFLREHIPANVRIHCIVTHGGEAPNIVPAFAQSWYYVRAPDRALVKDVYERVLNVARGAALMTGTELEVEFDADCHDFLPNRTLEAVLLSNMKLVGAPAFTASDFEFAEALVRTLPSGAVENAARALGKTFDELGGVLCTNVFESLGGLSAGEVQPISTDVGDVSHIVPTAQMTACCMPLGVQLHTWQAVASCGSSIGHRAMLCAAAVLGLTVVDLIAQPGKVRMAREEFARSTSGKYECPLPDDVRPPSRDATEKRDE